MLRPDSLLKHAGPALDIEVSEESVQDAERVSSDESQGWKWNTANYPGVGYSGGSTTTIVSNYPPLGFTLSDQLPTVSTTYAVPNTPTASVFQYTGGAAPTTISSPLPIQYAREQEREFAQKAQTIASEESAGALSIEGYDSSAEAVILDSHNWPLSDRTVKRIGEAALNAHVKYRIQAYRQLRVALCRT
jgi:hypothetical protein